VTTRNTRVRYGEEQECEKKRRNERHQDVGDGEMEKTMRGHDMCLLLEI
jgi:hypothetical protein